MWLTPERFGDEHVVTRSLKVAADSSKQPPLNAHS